MLLTRTRYIWTRTQSCDQTEGTRIEPKMPQCKWPVHKRGVSLASVVITEQSHTLLLPSRDVWHNLGERTNEWLLFETVIKKERSQPKWQRKVQTQLQKRCTAPTLLGQKAAGQTRGDKSCLAMSGDGEGESEVPACGSGPTPGGHQYRGKKRGWEKEVSAYQRNWKGKKLEWTLDRNQMYPWNSCFYTYVHMCVSV